jgi:hypothetical protein
MPFNVIISFQEESCLSLLVNVKKAVALKELSTFLENLQSKSLNLRTGKQLNTVLPTASDA